MPYSSFPGEKKEVEKDLAGGRYAASAEKSKTQIKMLRYAHHKKSFCLRIMVWGKSEPADESRDGNFLPQIIKERSGRMQQLSKKDYYNPFLFIRNDANIEILVKTLISNTTPPDQHGDDPFWEKSETALLVALIAYLYHYTQPSQQTFTNVMHLLRAAEVREDDSTYSSTLDEMFQQIEEIEPESFAVRQYKIFKIAEAKTKRSILISCKGRLQALA